MKAKDDPVNLVSSAKVIRKKLYPPIVWGIKGRHRIVADDEEIILSWFRYFNISRY